MQSNLNATPSAGDQSTSKEQSTATCAVSNVSNTNNQELIVDADKTDSPIGPSTSSKGKEKKKNRKKNRKERERIGKAGDQSTSDEQSTATCAASNVSNTNNKELIVDADKTDSPIGPSTSSKGKEKKKNRKKNRKERERKGKAAVNAVSTSQSCPSTATESMNYAMELLTIQQGVDGGNVHAQRGQANPWPNVVNMPANSAASTPLNKTSGDVFCPIISTPMVVPPANSSGLKPSGIDILYAAAIEVEFGSAGTVEVDVAKPASTSQGGTPIGSSIPPRRPPRRTLKVNKPANSAASTRLNKTSGDVFCPITSTPMVVPLANSSGLKPSGIDILYAAAIEVEFGRAGTVEVDVAKPPSTSQSGTPIGSSIPPRRPSRRAFKMNMPANSAASTPLNKTGGDVFCPIISTPMVVPPANSSGLKPSDLEVESGCGSAGTLEVDVAKPTSTSQGGTPIGASIRPRRPPRRTFKVNKPANSAASTRLNKTGGDVFCPNTSTPMGPPANSSGLKPSGFDSLYAADLEVESGCGSAGTMEVDVTEPASTSQSGTPIGSSIPPRRPSRRAFKVCTREGCPNPAVDNPMWDGEYCSEGCVVEHCKVVFKKFVASRQTSQSPRRNSSGGR